MEELVAIVSVELPSEATELGLNEAVAPVGKPLALSVTVPLKAFTLPTVTV